MKEGEQRVQVFLIPCRLVICLDILVTWEKEVCYKIDTICCMRCKKVRGWTGCNLQVKVLNDRMVEVKTRREVRTHDEEGWVRRHLKGEGGGLNEEGRMEEGIKEWLRWVQLGSEERRRTLEWDDVLMFNPWLGIREWNSLKTALKSSFPTIGERKRGKICWD